MTAVSSIKVKRTVYEPKKWCFSSNNSQPLSDRDTYDVVLLLNVLEHSNDPKALMNEVSKHLKPEGVLVIELPDERLSILRDLIKKRAYDFHVSTYCRRSIHQLLANQFGMEVSYSKYMRSFYRGNSTRTILITATHKASSDARFDFKDFRIFFIPPSRGESPCEKIIKNQHLNSPWNCWRSTRKVVRQAASILDT